MATLEDAFIAWCRNNSFELDGVIYENMFDSDYEIDRTNLDEEFANQTKRYTHYSFLAAHVENRAERLKSALEVVKATLDVKVRAEFRAAEDKDPKAKKSTETMISNEVLLRREYQDAFSEYQKARELSNILKNAPQAFNQRRDMLEQLARAHATGMTEMRSMNQQQHHVSDIFAMKQRAAAAAAVYTPALALEAPVPDDIDAVRADPENVEELELPRESSPTNGRRRTPKTS